MQFKYSKFIEFLCIFTWKLIKKKKPLVQAAKTKYFRNVKRLQNMQTQK
jgi:hypothetical protein